MAKGDVNHNHPGELLKNWYDACNGQVEPDGKNCTLCSDNDHQAFECQSNPFVQLVASLHGLNLYRYFPK